MRNKQKPLLLLDRDGTLIAETGYLKDPRKVKLLPGVAPALKQLARAGYPLVLVTNQSGVGRGLMTKGDVRKVHKRLEKLLHENGVTLDGIYWCPHHPQKHCACRKPKLALVRKAGRDLRRSWRNSISVGDKWSDIELGQRTGGNGILVLSGYGQKTWKARQGHRQPAYVARNVKTAARWILSARNKES